MINNQNEVMIDIETLSVNRNACILTIGAIKFKRNEKIPSFNEIKDENKFYYRIDLNSCKDLKLNIDENTQKWWNTQSKEARYEAFDHPDRIPLKNALIALQNFVKDCSIIWSQGSFDVVILDECYKICKLTTPWKYWSTRDCRTLFDIQNFDFFSFKNKYFNKLTIHNAIDDCYLQILALQKSLNI
jgi:hypothetical protein